MKKDVGQIELDSAEAVDVLYNDAFYLLSGMCFTDSVPIAYSFSYPAVEAVGEGGREVEKKQAKPDINSVNATISKRYSEAVSQARRKHPLHYYVRLGSAGLNALYTAVVVAACAAGFAFNIDMLAPIFGLTVGSAVVTGLMMYGYVKLLKVIDPDTVHDKVSRIAPVGLGYAVFISHVIASYILDEEMALAVTPVVGFVVGLFLSTSNVVHHIGVHSGLADGAKVSVQLLDGDKNAAYNVSDLQVRYGGHFTTKQICFIILSGLIGAGAAIGVHFGWPLLREQLSSLFNVNEKLQVLSEVGAKALNGGITAMNIGQYMFGALLSGACVVFVGAVLMHILDAVYDAISKPNTEYEQIV